MRTTQKQLIHRVLILAVGICVLTAACGSDTKKTATAAKSSAAANAASESAYCDTAREWAVHELVPYDNSDPAATKTWFDDYLAFSQRAAGQAPAELRDEWTLNVEAISTQLIPVLQKYEFNVQRLMAEGSDEEKSLIDQPPESIQEAQAAIHRYESNVCASEEPAAAEVDFSSEKRAAAFCGAIEADNEMVGAVNEAGMSPADVRKLATSKGFKDVLQKQRDTAPAVIKDDVEALDTFVQDKQLPLMAEHGYDIRKILLDGPQADREILQRTAPEVRDHYARVAAYEQQVCAAE